MSGQRSVFGIGAARGVSWIADYDHYDDYDPYACATRVAQIEDERLKEVRTGAGGAAWR